MLSDPDGVVAVQESLPEPVFYLFTLLTHLGDPIFLGVVVVGFYLFGRDERGEFVVGASVGAVALTATLKGLFESERPPESLALVNEAGFSFPSGHAVGAIVVSFALAEVLDTGTRPIRYGVATVFVGAVALSRVAIGVHYPIDVIGGVVVGGVYLFLVTWDRPDPEVAFSAALTVAVVGVALGSEYYLPVSVGLPLGGYIGWHLTDDRYELSDIAKEPEAVLVVLLPAVTVAMISPVGRNVVFQTLGLGICTGGVFFLPHVLSLAR